MNLCFNKLLNPFSQEVKVHNMMQTQNDSASRDYFLHIRDERLKIAGTIAVRRTGETCVASFSAAHYENGRYTDEPSKKAGRSLALQKIEQGVDTVVFQLSDIVVDPVPSEYSDYPGLKNGQWVSEPMRIVRHAVEVLLQRHLLPQHLKEHARIFLDHCSVGIGFDHVDAENWLRRNERAKARRNLDAMNKPSSFIDRLSSFFSNLW